MTTWTDAMPADDCTCRWVNHSDYGGWELRSRNPGCPQHGVGPATYRVLVTGSRTWDDAQCVSSELSLAIVQSGHAPADVTVITGACPKGADAMAEQVAAYFGYQVERHPADWDQFGKSAGFRRNAKMVALGANLCLAFIRSGSPGATHCADLAEKAGIPVRRFRAGEG